MYFLREFSGVVIAFYLLYLLWMMLQEDDRQISTIFSLIALIFAIFHALTWFYVTSKIVSFGVLGRYFPVLVKFGGLLLIWGVVSYLIFTFFYV